MSVKAKKEKPDDKEVREFVVRYLRANYTDLAAASSDCDEITSEVRRRLWLHPQKYDGNQYLREVTYTVVAWFLRRRMVDRARFTSLEAMEDEDGEPSSCLAVTTETPEHHCIAQETLSLLVKSFSSLRPGEKEIIDWKKFHGLDYIQIAAIAGTSPDAAKMRYSRAMKQWREAYQRLVGQDSS